MIDLDKLLELESRATPGKWTKHRCDSPWYIQSKTENGDVFEIVDKMANEDNAECDAELIASMRNSIRQLCLELKAARSATEILRRIISEEDLFNDTKTLAREALKTLDEVTGTDGEN